MPGALPPLLNVERLVPFDDPAATERQDQGQRFESQAEARDFGEDALGSEDHPAGVYVVFRSVPGTSETAGFVDAALPIYNAGYRWSYVGGTAFQFYEDSGHAGTQYERTLGMATMPAGYLGLTYIMNISEPTYDATLHRFKLNNVYWRFRDNMSAYKDGTWTWGNTDAYHVIDRESIVAHELGHALTLNDVTYLVLNSKQTMYYQLYGNDGSADRTGTWMRSPSIDDAIGLNSLY